MSDLNVDKMKRERKLRQHKDTLLGNLRNYKELATPRALAVLAHVCELVELPEIVQVQPMQAPIGGCEGKAITAHSRPVPTDEAPEMASELEMAKVIAADITKEFADDLRELVTQQRLTRQLKFVFCPYMLFVRETPEGERWTLRYAKLTV